MSASTFAATFVALYAAHEVGDHWLQSHAEALGKGDRSWRGRWLCASHVAVLTAAKTFTLAVVAVALGMALNPCAAGAALLVDAASHYWADRRTTLVALADWLGRTAIPGKGEFARLGDGKAAPTGTGAYALDQSWHIGWLLVAALIASAGVA